MEIRLFEQKYKMLSIYSEGISASIGGNSTVTIHTREFLIEKATEKDIKQSFTGTSRSFGVSAGLFLSVNVGKTYAVNEKTGEKDHTGWSGLTGGSSIGLGANVSMAEQECVYVFDDDLWSDPEVDKWFYEIHNRGGN